MLLRQCRKWRDLSVQQSLTRITEDLNNDMIILMTIRGPSSLEAVQKIVAFDGNQRSFNSFYIFTQYWFLIHFNIIILSTPLYRKWSLPFRINNYLTLWNTDVLEKLADAQLAKNFNGNRICNMVFTWVRHWSLPRIKWIQWIMPSSGMWRRVVLV
jgi:hypothetical protein